MADSYSELSTTWSDTFLNTFFLFRLGNFAIQSQTYHYYPLRYRILPSLTILGQRSLQFLPDEKQKTRPDPHRAAISYLPSECKIHQLPEKASHHTLRMVVISDSHDRHHVLDTLPDCDLLIHAGDILMTSRKFSPQCSYQKYQEFMKWFRKQPAKHKIIIGGNHDFLLQRLSREELDHLFDGAYYLCNQVITLEGITIFGTPLSSGDSGNQAFQSREFYEETEEAIAYYQSLPNVPPIDILITHGGCSNLRSLVRPQLFHVSGHSHYFHGVYLHSMKDNSEEKILNVCAPIMNERYNPVFLPVVVDCMISP